jgi:hypothetical protein
MRPTEVRVQSSDDLRRPGASKNPKAQENELLCKFIAYNLTVLIHEIHELGIKPDFCSKCPPPTQEVS